MHLGQQVSDDDDYDDGNVQQIVQSMVYRIDQNLTIKKA